MYRVLIVDDHAAVRQGVRQVLDERLHPDAQGEASNADEAIDMVRRFAWDVVILDVNMPRKGGMAALREIKRHSPDLPVVIFSVYPPEQIAARFMAAGASGYVSKAGPAEDLVGAVERAVSDRDASNTARLAAISNAASADDAVTAWRL